MREIKFRAWNSNTKRFELAGDLWLISGFITGSIDKGSSAYLQFQQSTGLKDKNGVEIYEGDIVKRVDVEFGMSWQIRNDDYFYQDVFDLQRFIERGDKYEVIGNIYEAPDLLKASKVPDEPLASQQASPNQPSSEERK